MKIPLLQSPAFQKRFPTPLLPAARTEKIAQQALMLKQRTKNNPLKAISHTHVQTFFQKIHRLHRLPHRFNSH